jgi:hypothetical protein
LLSLGPLGKIADEAKIDTALDRLTRVEKLL